MKLILVICSELLSTTKLFTNEIFDDINSGIYFIIPLLFLNHVLYVCLEDEAAIIIHQPEIIH